jgi:phosphoribosylamine-glycine ligase
MQKNLKAIVLGGTAAHIDLINNLKKRGYYTFLIDYYENPIAKEFADRHIQESTLDKEKVLEIAKAENVDLVISTSVDQANLTACYCLERLGMHTPYSYETAIEVTNKILMKKKMVDNGIPTAKHFIIKSLDDLDGINLKYPLIVKPSDCNGSKGVRKADNLLELKSFTWDALKISRTKEAIVEEFIFGKEIGLDCFVKDGFAEIVMTRHRRKIIDDDDNVQQIYGSFWPDDLSLKKMKKYSYIANKIAKVFKLVNTPLMIQLLINDEKINVIEFAPRIGGGENARIIKLSANFDIIDAAVCSYLGEKIILNYTKPKMYFADNLIYCNSGRFKEIINYEKFIEDRTIEYLVNLKEKGSNIGKDLSSNNRVGAFVVKADNKKDLFFKIEKVFKNIDVVDLNNKSIIKKEIFENYIKR